MSLNPGMVKGRLTNGSSYFEGYDHLMRLCTSGSGGSQGQCFRRKISATHEESLAVAWVQISL
jgi:hypothetical protein